MSKWAQKRKRRLIIISGVVIIALISLIVFSVLNKPATCFDGIQNNGETGIDCGGACQAVCREEVRDIVVWWERPFKVANGVYNTVAYFENQNLESGLQELTYEFRLYNYDNVIVSQPIVGTTFIEPNKRSAVFESGVTTGDQEVYTAFFKVSSVQDWKKADQTFAYNLFQIGEPILTNQEISPRLQAPIKNTSFDTFNNVPVIAIIYNQEDNAIAASQTFIDTVGQGETENAYFSWPEPFGDSVSRIEIIPRVDPFTDA